MTWSDLGGWWISEVETDPAYRHVLTPMLMDVLNPLQGCLYLDLGSGDGRVMKAVKDRGAAVHGLDINTELAARSSDWGPAMVGEMPALEFISPDGYDEAYCVLVLEHIKDHEDFFQAVTPIVRPRGVLALVMNHPIWTAPGSTPITDTACEVLWRLGDYFSGGTTDAPAGEESVTFHHRTISELLNAAAEADWGLERIIETPLHESNDLQGIPRLLAFRWRHG